MLNIQFHSKDGQKNACLDLTTNLYQQLGRSDFSKIGGASKLTKLTIEGEKTELLLIKLTKANRKQFRTFLLNAIATESAAMLKTLASKEQQLGGDTYNAMQGIEIMDYTEASFNLATLLELLSCIENETFYYIERI
jgi:hypothetical protein